MSNDMPDDRPPPSLDDIEARLRKARDGSRAGRGNPGDGEPAQGTQSWIGMGFRIGVELVAAMVVGVGGGVLLDRWLGTSPWLLILMFLLASAAAMLNVWRAINGMGSAMGFGQVPPQDDNSRSSRDR
jgi:ATP synthase protein I